VITGEDAFLYINAGEEVNAYDCKRGSVCAGAREEVKAFDHEIRSALKGQQFCWLAELCWVNAA